MDGDAIRHSRPHRMSLQDGRRFFGHSHENEAILPSWNNFSQRFRRKSLQTHVLDRMVPVEDMDPFEGFQPFTTLEPGHQAAPVTVRELTKDLPKPPFEYAWKPSVTFPEIGGMRVRVGRFERSAHFAKDTTPSVRYPDSPGDGNESSFEDSGSEGYFTAQDWTTPSITSEGSTIGPFPHVITPPPSLPQPDFIQGSSNSVLPFKTQSLTSGLDHRHPSIMGNDNVQFPHLEELLQHYAAVQREEKWVSPPQQTGPPCYVVEPTLSAPAPALRSPATFEHPEGSIVFHPQRGSCDAKPLNDPSTLTGPLRTGHTRRSIMPGTLPGTKIVDYRSDSTPSFADRITEAAVDECEDWAAREPWEYIHRVLTSSTYPLVVFLKMPTVDIPAAALGVLGADLHLQKMLIDNEHWLLIGPRDVNLHEFGVKFQTRARTPEKFVFRFGNLNWGADVNQIEDEVCKAVIESSNRGRGMPATLPAQFMAGAIGGFVVCHSFVMLCSIHYQYLNALHKYNCYDEV
ncbi:hypothetical protein B0F90DRAFT_516988 [Multifurca ochricompacta]|uniref:Uncharacterized protein n=1 Tax=Multifurca ochricompacta TaxID=376703 RepID=A0AAD4QST7_9AGAM|nr:hypothetical protein B0F90DRAFT_516988 [Multifurca ochricompacta]